MNLINMFASQEKLDNRIIVEKGLDRLEIFQHRIFAMAKELTELAQELQGEWKFWKSNVTHDREKIVEEYIDGFHFLLGLGNELKFNEQCGQLLESARQHMKTGSIFDQLVEVDKWVARMYDDAGGSYINLFCAYYNLGFLLNITEEQMEEAYFKKNKVNHERQDNQY